MKNKSLCALSIIVLFCSFFSNTWKVADQQWFNSFHRENEILVIGRMLKSRQDGMTSAGGLLGLVSPNSIPATTPDEYLDYHYLAFDANLPFNAYSPYKSLIGGQGIIFSFLDKLLPLSSQHKLRLFQAITALASAIVFALIVLWFLRNLGLFAALSALVSVVLSQWLAVFGRQLYWSIWAFYLPMLCILYLLERNRIPSRRLLYKFAGIVFISVFLKCFINGYEYITTALVMMLCPLVFYAVFDRYSMRILYQYAFMAAIGSVLAITLSLAIQCAQIAAVEGDWMSGVNHVVFSLKKRSYADPQALPAEYAASMQASPFSVMLTYLKGIYFDANNYFSISNPVVSKLLLRVRYFYLVIGFLAATMLLYLRRDRWETGEQRRKAMALIAVTWFSLLAPLSWFVIFKAHSFVHIHLNFITWQMPFTIFGFALCGVLARNFNCLVSDRIAHHNETRQNNHNLKEAVSGILS